MAIAPDSTVSYLRLLRVSALGETAYDSVCDRSCGNASPGLCGMANCMNVCDSVQQPAVSRGGEESVMLR